MTIAPLLAPYRGRGRLSLRIENVPQRARFSGGRNNGDNSWSLATDELDGLQYLPAAGPLEPHALSIRILSADAAGEVSTVAVVDYPVRYDAAEPAREPTAKAAPPRDFKGESPHDVKLSRLEAELERVRAVLTAHENVLSATEQRAGRATTEASAQTIEREVAKARVAWDDQQDRRLAETTAQAAAELERRRDTWQAEMDARLAQSEEAARQELADARERWRLEMQATLANAERAWKADESARLAGAEAEWRKQAGAASARASAEEVAARDRAEAEVQRLREKLSEALATVADREATLAKTQLEAGRVREIALKERDVALRAAQKSWQSEEAKRFAQAEAAWREETTNVQAELTARYERAEAALAEALAAGGKDDRAQVEAENARNRAERDLSEMRVQFSALKKTLVDSEAEIGRLRESVEGARERAQLDMDGVLERAQAAWRSEAAARLAAAKAKWSQESAQSLAAAHAEVESVRGVHTAELRELQEELAAAHARLSGRDSDLVRMGAESREANERLQQEARAQLAAAQRAWKAEEAARLSAAKAEWQKSSSNALAEATVRYQAAETALARQRAKTEDELRRGENNTDDSDHLREQIVLLQAALARCERELAHLRSGAQQQSYDAAQATAQQNWAPLTREFGAAAQEDAPEEEERKPFLSLGILREAIALFALVAGVVISFPYWLPYLPDEWQEEIVAFLGTAPAAPPPKPAPPSPPKLAIAPPPHLELVVGAANLRSDPSLSADVVSRAADGTEVAVVEQRGDWTHVRTTSKSGTASEGWIYNSHLKDESPAKP